MDFEHGKATVKDESWWASIDAAGTLLTKLDDPRARRKTKKE